MCMDNKLSRSRQCIGICKLYKMLIKEHLKACKLFLFRIIFRMVVSFSDKPPNQSTNLIAHERFMLLEMRQWIPSGGDDDDDDADGGSIPIVQSTKPFWMVNVNKFVQKLRQMSFAIQTTKHIWFAMNTSLIWIHRGRLSCLCLGYRSTDNRWIDFV